jgi:nucleotide-binding universal stress UspA family protein
MQVRILAGTDFSTRSHRALRRAGLLAKARHAELVVVHVVDDDQPQDLVEIESREAERILAGQIDAIDELRGARCRALVVAGDPFEGILSAANAVDADLIVLGAHRKQVLRDIFIGTTIERVIRIGPYPVLMVNGDAERAYGNVLAAGDMSPPSARAIRVGKDLGLFDGPRLTFVNGFLTVGASLMARADITRDDIENHIAEERIRTGTELAAFVRGEDLQVEDWALLVREGTPIEVIAATIKDVRPDLLLIGTQGRSGIPRVLLGSVAEQVLRSVEVDVLAVPPVR